MNKKILIALCWKETVPCKVKGWVHPRDGEVVAMTFLKEEFLTEALAEEALKGMKKPDAGSWYEVKTIWA